MDREMNSQQEMDFQGKKKWGVGDSGKQSSSGNFVMKLNMKG